MVEDENELDSHFIQDEGIIKVSPEQFHFLITFLI